jgi:sigma-B regulation protein RsbU (phosphoserine phosphatase)
MPKLIGEVFVERGYASDEQIQLALRLQSQSSTHKRLGQILIEQGVLSHSQTESMFSERESLLLQLIARINSTLDTESLLATIMESAEEMMGAQASSLFLLDRKTRELLVAVPTGPVRAEILGRRIPRGQGFCGWVAEHGDPLVVHNAREDFRFFGDIAERFRTVDLICVPLRNPRGEILGVLEAINRRDGAEFTQGDIPLFSALADHVAIALERAQLHREQLEKQRLEQQLSWAELIQQGFLRKEMPIYPGLSFAALYVPAIYVSGDYYDVVPIDQERCALVIADVSGKGPAAALLMATFRAVLQAQVARNLSVPDTVRLTNAIMVKDVPLQSFVTLFYGLLDTAKGDLTYVNAGHNPPMLYDPTRNEIDFLGAGGTIIGFSASATYESQRLALRPGQLLVMYTDGVTEACNPREEFFGQERLRALVLRHGRDDARTALREIHESVLQFTEGAPQADDITLLLTRIA